MPAGGVLGAGRGPRALRLSLGTPARPAGSRRGQASAAVVSGARRAGVAGGAGGGQAGAVEVPGRLPGDDLDDVPGVRARAPRRLRPRAGSLRALPGRRALSGCRRPRALRGLGRAGASRPRFRRQAVPAVVRAGALCRSRPAWRPFGGAVSPSRPPPRPASSAPVLPPGSPGRFGRPCARALAPRSGFPPPLLPRPARFSRSAPARRSGAPGAGRRPGSCVLSAASCLPAPRRVSPGPGLAVRGSVSPARPCLSLPTWACSHPRARSVRNHRQHGVDGAPRGVSLGMPGLRAVARASDGQRRHVRRRHGPFFGRAETAPKGGSALDAARR